MTFAEIEEALGLPRATVCRHMKRNKWRIVGKLKLPPGAEKPKQRLCSKRYFIGKAHRFEEGRDAHDRRGHGRQ